MRARLITSVAVLALCVAFIAWSTGKAYSVLDNMDEIAINVMNTVRSGDVDSGTELLGEMAVEWESQRPFMEAIMPHEDLQRVIELFTEAQANLEAKDVDDFARSMALFRETLDHLRAHEKFSWSNIL